MSAEIKAKKVTPKKRTSKAAQANALAAQPAAAAAGPLAPIVAEPLRVSMIDLLHMQLAYAEMREAKAVAEQHKMARLYALTRIDPKGLILGLEGKRDEALKLAEHAEHKAVIARRRMEFAIGRPLDGVGINPETGEVQIPQ